jgi:hypothetical protein
MEEKLKHEEAKWSEKLKQEEVKWSEARKKDNKKVEVVVADAKPKGDEKDFTVIDNLELDELKKQVAMLAQVSELGRFQLIVMQRLAKKTAKKNEFETKWLEIQRNHAEQVT